MMKIKKKRRDVLMSTGPGLLRVSSHKDMTIFFAITLRLHTQYMPRLADAHMNVALRIRHSTEGFDAFVYVFQIWFSVYLLLRHFHLIFSVLSWYVSMAAPS